METKKTYAVPKAEKFGFSFDVVLASSADNLTQDKEWAEWLGGEQ